MISNVFFDCEIIADCVCAAVRHDHSLAFPTNLIVAVVQKVGHDHFRFLRDGIPVLLVIFEQGTGSLSLNEFRVILRNTDQLESLFDGGVVGQYIQNIALFNRLTHGVHMEWCLDGFTFRGYSHHGTKRFQSLPLGGGGKGKERLIVMSALADDCIDVLVG